MKRIAAVMGIALVCGCNDERAKQPPPSTTTPRVITALVLPKVDVEAALAPASIRLPSAVAQLDADGAVRVTVPPTAWGPLDRNAPSIDSGVPFNLPSSDDEDFDDDEGGTGTALALEAGGAPNRPAPPAPSPAPDAAARGSLGDVWTRASTSRADVLSGTPRRVTTATGWVTDGDFTPPQPRVLVAADPRTPARAVVDAMTSSLGMIAVDHRGAVRVLRVDFAHRAETTHGERTAPWCEVRVDSSGLSFEGVPDEPTAIAWPAGAALDTAAVAKAWLDVRTRRGLTARTDVDVLVGDGVDAQRLIDLIVALDGVGARSISLGRTPTPGSPDAVTRGHASDPASADPSVAGGLDRQVIREVVRRHLARITYCYERALQTQPTLTGTVHAQFYIAPNGEVQSATASGMDPGVASCVADALRGLTFPKPRGGGTQVNYPFNFRAP